MAYSSTNPPTPMYSPLTRASSDGDTQKPPQLWLYRSTHRSTEIDDASFFSNGHDLGMREGDGMIAMHVSSAGSTTIAMIAAIVTDVTTAGATVIASTLVSST